MKTFFQKVLDVTLRGKVNKKTKFDSKQNKTKKYEKTELKSKMDFTKV